MLKQTLAFSLLASSVISFSATSVSAAPYKTVDQRCLRKLSSEVIKMKPMTRNKLYKLVPRSQYGKKYEQITRDLILGKYRRISSNFFRDLNGIGPRAFRKRTGGLKNLKGKKPLTIGYHPAYQLANTWFEGSKRYFTLTVPKFTMGEALARCTVVRDDGWK